MISWAAFAQEYLGERRVLAVEQEIALQLWCRYYSQTEAFDRGRCRGRSERGTAIPGDFYEQSDCSRNAKRLHDELLHEAARRRVSGDVLRRMKDMAAIMTFEAQQATAARLDGGGDRC